MEIYERTHTCTSCNTEIYYTSSGGWYNARTKLNITSILRCQPCAGKEGREASDKEIPGRPKGSKTSEDRRMNHSRPGSGKRLNASLTKTQRLNAIGKRYGYSSYKEYRETMSDWEKYKVDVRRITETQPIQLLENYDKRGVCGQEGAYQLDHIYSIFKGFKNQVPPSIVGHIDNLQMITWEENNKKRYH